MRRPLKNKKKMWKRSEDCPLIVALYFAYGHWILFFFCIAAAKRKWCQHSYIHEHKGKIRHINESGLIEILLNTTVQHYICGWRQLQWKISANTTVPGLTDKSWLTQIALQAIQLK